MKFKTISIIFAILAMFVMSVLISSKSQDLDLVAIANYGPHSSLEESIKGLKEGLEAKGYIEGKNIRYEILDVNFDTSLIYQMVSKLKASKPKVLVTLSTPVTQSAKQMIKDVPIIFMDITDPVEAGILKEYDKPNGNVTGSSDLQDFDAIMKFAKSILADSDRIKRIGVLYSTGEANDYALVKFMQKAAHDNNMELYAVPVESARDVQIRMHQFKNKVDIIYVGSSGAVQPSLPAIVSLAEKMNIPVLNMNSKEVKDNNVLLSFGVSFYKVGINASEQVVKILRGVSIRGIEPIYPKKEDHEAYLNLKRLKKIDLKIKDSLLKYVYIVQ
jgi:putative ABC transport system substrate-binding protein